jgi:hypothetical protein
MTIFSYLSKRGDVVDSNSDNTVGNELYLLLELVSVEIRFLLPLNNNPFDSAENYKFLHRKFRFEDTANPDSLEANNYIPIITFVGLKMHWGDEDAV